MNLLQYTLSLLFWLRTDHAVAFSAIVATKSHSRRLQSSSLIPRFLAGSSSNDDMRRMLEASWNVEAMGGVPTDFDTAAEAAVTSTMNAMDQAGSDSAGIFNLDILLPQYDVEAGKNLYDEVSAVDFCIALANRFKGKSSIVVRDDETIRVVSRVLDARERERSRATAQPVVEVEDDMNDEDMPDDDEDDISELEDRTGDAGTSSRREIGKAGSSEVDSFREQLMAGWEDSSDDFEAAPSKPSSPTNKRKSPKVAASSSTTASALPKRYRLCSMFGDAIIAQGADMMGDAVRAVAANAQPKEDEETIIILSAVTREEMIGVRSLVAKYQGEKKFILVNCKMDPIPVELVKAQTVYSILPLIAKPVVSDTNIFAAKKNKDSKLAEEKPPVTKLVIMRRFPRDWEVFVDYNGQGFELAATVPASQVPQKGPPMEWVSSSVKRFLQTRAL